MISTSILYCNKLDALPLSIDRASQSTCSNSVTNSVTNSSASSGGRFRVRYLGSTSCNVNDRKLKDGLSAFQKPLLDLYGTTRRRTIAHRNFYPFALNQVIDVCTYGVVVAQRDPTIIRINRKQIETVVTKVITPLSNIVLWAAVRFNCRVTEKSHSFGAAFVPLSCSDAVLTKDSFVSLTSKQRFLVGLQHPPLFVCVLQKVASPRELECHMFVCASSEDAINLCCLLGDTQKHCSKIGVLELPPAGQMGNYSYKSPSRLSKSVSEGQIKHMSNDTLSESSRVGGNSTSASSYKSRSTPNKSKYKFRPLPQQKHLQQNLYQHKQQQLPYERKTQIEDIHTKSSQNLPLISVQNTKPMLHLRDYRSRSYRHSDCTPTPTTSSSSERQYYDQKYQWPNNSKNFLENKREMRKVYGNSNNSYTTGYSSSITKRGIKVTPKTARRNHNSAYNDNLFGQLTKIIRKYRNCCVKSSDHNNWFLRGISNGHNEIISSIHCKSCGTSSDSSEIKSGTKPKIQYNINGEHRVNNNNKCDNNYYKRASSHDEITRPRHVTVPYNSANNYISNYAKNDTENDNNRQQKIVAKQLLHNNGYKHVANDSGINSSDSLSIGQITNKRDVIKNIDLKQRLNGNNCSIVPKKEVQSIQTPQRRYFGDTIRGAKTFTVSDAKNGEISSANRVSPQPRCYVRVRNATTSCRDAPWILNGKNSKQMLMSETIFLGSEESDSKKSTNTVSDTSNTPLLRKSSKSWPNINGNYDDESDSGYVCRAGKQCIPEENGQKDVYSVYSCMRNSFLY